MQWFHGKKSAVTNIFAKKKCRSTRALKKGQPSICEFTKQPHLHLSGLSGKSFKTSHAAEYPMAFARSLVEANGVGADPLRMARGHAGPGMTIAQSFLISPAFESTTDMQLHGPSWYVIMPYPGLKHDRSLLES